MTIACPACRADNAERTCRRCKADLGMLWDLEATRSQLLADGYAALDRRDADAATAAGESARALRDDVDAIRLIACGHLLARRFDEAAKWHARGS